MVYEEGSGLSLHRSLQAQRGGSGTTADALSPIYKFQGFQLLEWWWPAMVYEVGSGL
jgi:hypothetical protein